MRALVREIFISELTAVFAHSNYTVPVKKRTEKGTEGYKKRPVS